jgi:hypothetical protein
VDPSFQHPVKAALKTDETWIKCCDETRNVTGEAVVEDDGLLSPSHRENGAFGLFKVRMVSPEAARVYVLEVCPLTGDISLSDCASLATGQGQTATSRTKPVWPGSQSLIRYP